MAGWFTAICNFIAALMDYYRDRQLLEAGRDKEKADVLEKGNRIRKKAKEIKREIDTLPSADVTARLSKYIRK